MRGSQTDTVQIRSRGCQTDLKMKDTDIIPKKEALQHQLSEQKLRIDAENAKKEAIRFRTMARQEKAEAFKLNRITCNLKDQVSILNQEVKTLGKRPAIVKPEEAAELE